MENKFHNTSAHIFRIAHVLEKELLTIITPKVFDRIDSNCWDRRLWQDNWEIVIEQFNE